MLIKLIVWDGITNSKPDTLECDVEPYNLPVANQIFFWPTAGAFYIIDVPDENTIIARNVSIWSGPSFTDGANRFRADVQSNYTNYPHWKKENHRLKDKDGIIHQLVPGDLTSYTLCWRDNWHRCGPLIETFEKANCIGCIYEQRRRLEKDKEAKKKTKPPKPPRIPKS